MAEKLGALGIGDGTRVVIHDRSDGMWAARLWWMLHTVGFDAAAVLDGGCGAGVAASLEAFALRLLRHADVAVYDGSLLEWCADPDLPLDP